MQIADIDILEPTQSQRRMTRILNDLMRRGAMKFGPARNRYTITRGVQNLLADASEGYVTALVRMMAAIAGCEPTPGNDAYGEHDMGRIEFNSERLFWKIDYYDPSYTYGSGAPWDDLVTRRVMTVMLANEY